MAAHILTSISGSADDLVPIRRALLSVSDKSGLIELAQFLHGTCNAQLLSTGGTAAAIRNAGIPVMDVSEYTGSPEVLDGRVKTLHPKIHGGLLGVRGNPKHEAEMVDNNIGTIDLVVMNLYPFEATVNSGAEFGTCIENIDIGGPSMLRSSAKNHQYVSILTNPSQYADFMQTVGANNGANTLAMRKRLAAQAFATSAAYDANISAYFAGQLGEAAPVVTKSYKPEVVLKYGCNPHQKPSVIYSSLGSKLPFTVVNGTPGYINLLDACNAWQLVLELKQALGLPAAASFKHCSPAGAAIGVPLSAAEALAYEIADPSTLSPTALAYVRARNADPMCSFGDFAAISHIVDVSTAMVFKAEVCDGLIAPGFEPEALEILKAKKKGGFILLQADESFIAPLLEYRDMYGVTFSQRRNDTIFTEQHLNNLVAGEALSVEAKRDLVLASIAIKYTQSNSVGYAKNGQMIGVGAGQQSRVDCVKLAGRKVAIWYLRMHSKVQALPFKKGVKRTDRVNARVRYIEGDMTANEMPKWLANFDTTPEPLTEQEKTEYLATLSGVSISSDAFFPFRDSIDHASKFGVQFIAQAGGSVADEEVKAACGEYGMSMVMTGLRLFHH
jgi:phosphoribosylaminoimidazolecarboxamide formyltransferase/IMP cyclohydrolase